MKEIKCFSTHDNALIFQSIGIEVFISADVEVLIEHIKSSLSNEVKILLIDEDISDSIVEIKERYDDESYPIFLNLPFGDKLTGKSLNEMKKSIEKAIGISVF